MAGEEISNLHTCPDRVRTVRRYVLRKVSAGISCGAVSVGNEILHVASWELIRGRLSAVCVACFVQVHKKRLPKMLGPLIADALHIPHTCLSV